MTDRQKYERAREAIAACGGVTDRTGLGARWQVSRAAVHGYVQRPDFPRPLLNDASRKEVWLVSEADEWLARYLEGEL